MSERDWRSDHGGQDPGPYFGRDSDPQPGSGFFGDQPDPRLGAEPPPSRAGRRRHAARRSGRNWWPRIALALVAVLGLAAVGYVLAGGADGLLPPGAAAPPAATPTGSASPEPSGEPRAESTTEAAVGNGKFSFAKADSKIVGSKGKLLRYRVAVEQGADVDTKEFAAQVKAVLGDPKGWTGTGKHRFQRVAEAAQKDFTVFLATAATSKKMCAAGGLHTDGYLSCRLGGQVIINLDRWLTAVPHYIAELAEYRAFALNHEIGHQLGKGHEACPEAGQPAPVMQQQSLDLDGCTPYGWPLRDGKAYSGIPIP